MPISWRINKIINEMLNRNNDPVLKSTYVIDPCSLYGALNGMSREDLEMFKKQIGNSLELIDEVVRVKTAHPKDPRQNRNCVVVPGNAPTGRMSIAINDIIEKMLRCNTRMTSSYVIYPCELYAAVNEMSFDEIAVFKEQWKSSDKMVETISGLREKYPNHAQQCVSRALESTVSNDSRMELTRPVSSALACTRVSSQVGHVLALKAPVV